MLGSRSGSLLPRIGVDGGQKYGRVGGPLTRVKDGVGGEGCQVAPPAAIQGNFRERFGGTRRRGTNGAPVAKDRVADGVSGARWRYSS